MDCKRIRKLAACCLSIAILICFPICSVFAAADDVIGNVPRLLSASGYQNALYEECNFGDVLADAVRSAVQCDIAVINGGDLLGNVQPGEVTEEMLNACIQPDRTIATVVVTPKQLACIFEETLSHTRLGPENSYLLPVSQHGAFPQISGITLFYALDMPAGERVVRILKDKEELDLEDSDTQLTLAATTFMLSGGYDMTPVKGYSETEWTLTDALRVQIEKGLNVSERAETRIHPIGIKTNKLPIGYLVLMVGVIALLIMFFGVPMAKKASNLAKAIAEDVKEDPPDKEKHQTRT